ncbi:hypothetical protein [Cellvibrio sp. PSBB023]|uniref:hypothetical protein n=1 Tax=Cellvibrio sp. PSBB023 TaxID=1945512 RepID=UPI001FEFA732|nr:hypothetical protein [Cellvibrio sp. PSBB023]
MEAEALIARARAELAELIPWVNLDDAEWACLPIDRAEPLQPGFVRPDNAFVAPATGASNLLVGWPTKLTLAPNLANQALALLTSGNIAPIHPQTSLLTWLPLASLAKTPWEQAFPPALSAEEALALRFREPDDEQP